MLEGSFDEFGSYLSHKCIIPRTVRIKKSRRYDKIKMYLINPEHPFYSRSPIDKVHIEKSLLFLIFRRKDFQIRSL